MCVYGQFVCVLVCRLCKVQIWLKQLVRSGYVKLSSCCLIMLLMVSFVLQWHAVCHIHPPSLLSISISCEQTWRQTECHCWTSWKWVHWTYRYACVDMESFFADRLSLLLCLIFEDVLNHAIMCIIIIIIPICLLHPSVNITHYTDMSVSKDVNLLAWALCKSIYSTQEDFF